MFAILPGSGYTTLTVGGAHNIDLMKCGHLCGGRTRLACCECAGITDDICDVCELTPGLESADPLRTFL